LGHDFYPLTALHKNEPAMYTPSPAPSAPAWRPASRNLWGGVAFACSPHSRGRVPQGCPRYPQIRRAVTPASAVQLWSAAAPCFWQRRRQSPCA